MKGVFKIRWLISLMDRRDEKYARTMKASSIVSTDEYTAFISNDGKGITVFNYTIQGVH